MKILVKFESEKELMRDGPPSQDFRMKTGFVFIIHILLHCTCIYTLYHIFVVTSDFHCPRIDTISQCSLMIQFIAFPSYSSMKLHFFHYFWWSQFELSYVSKVRINYCNATFKLRSMRYSCLFHLNVII